MEGTLNVEMRFLSKSFKYMMVPVYVAATKYNKKVYNQYVSGIFSDDKQHSKVCGKAPVSPWKVLLTVLAGIAVISGIVLLNNSWSSARAPKVSLITVTPSGRLTPTPSSIR